MTEETTDGQIEEEEPEDSSSEVSEDYEYSHLLNRAREDLPEEISHHERFEVPDVDSFLEGNTTIIKNFSDIASTINRDPDKLLKYLLRELGTAGERDNGRVVFKGKISPKKIEQKLEDYVDKYVLCSECGRPDTRMVKEGRVTIIQCDACGAHHPVRGKKKKAHTSKSEKIEEGGIYELMIQDIGREGDGMAKVGNFTIYVPGTTKGEKVKVRIEHIKGNLAFGSVVGKGSK